MSATGSLVGEGESLDDMILWVICSKQNSFSCIDMLNRWNLMLDFLSAVTRKSPWPYSSHEMTTIRGKTTKKTEEPTDLFRNITRVNGKPKPAW